MCNEHFGLVKGRLKLPIIRGDHSPNCDSYLDMEKAMSKDLNSWLCNMYLEIRALPIETLTRYMNISSKSFELDYLNKSVMVHRNGTDTMSKLLRTNDDRKSIDKGLYRRTTRPKPDQLKKESNNATQNDLQVLNPLSDDEDDDKNEHNSDSESDKGKATNKSWRKYFKNFFHNKSSKISDIEEGKPLLSHNNDSDHENHDEINDHNDKEEGFEIFKVHSDSDENEPEQEHENEEREIPEKEIPPAIDTSFTDHNLEHNNNNENENTNNDDELFVNQSNKTRNELSEKNHIDEINRSTYAVPEVIERGYNSEDDFFLHEEQRGKLSGLETISNHEGKKWAKSMQEGIISRRLVNFDFDLNYSIKFV